MSAVKNGSSVEQSSEKDELEKGEFPLVPESAIVKPEDERPVKTHITPEESLEEKEVDIEYLDAGSEDIDRDGSPDWDPAIGP